MEQLEKKYFADPQTGSLNGDNADFAIGQNQWVNMENCRTGSTDKAVVGAVESVGGTLLLSEPQPSVTFLTIGAAEETERNRIINFKFNTTGTNHKIVCYDKTDNFEYDVLLSTQVRGGLNFSKHSIIHSAQIISGILMWPDSTNNEPRKINVDSAIKANYPSYKTDRQPYSYPLDFSEITLIKPPPPLSPNIQKLRNIAFENNFIATESFMFAFLYNYNDNEITVLGTYSPSSRLNKVGENENYIKVTMDTLERIPSTVRRVKLVARFSNSNNAFIIKVWDKDIQSEAQKIEDQNSGVQGLTFDFYNNITGEAIPTEPVNLVLKPFDSVPIYSETAATARGKYFLGNNTEGYNTPLTTSLSLGAISTSINIGGTLLSKTLISIFVRNGRAQPETFAFSGWFVYLTEVTPVGIYLINGTNTLREDTSFIGGAVYGNGGDVPLPNPANYTTVAFSGLTFKGTNLTEVPNNIRPPDTYRWDGPYIEFTNFPTLITGLTTQTYDVFKTRSQYKFGVVFYDFAMRKCGVVTNDGLIFEIPSRDFAFSSGISGIVWTLNNINTIKEIPIWAYYYTPVRTLNLRTRFFFQSFTNAAKYVTKDTEGNYIFTSNTFVNGSVGIGLNTTALIQSGLGYVFTDGDVCILTKSDNTTSILPVIGQDGNYIIVKADNLGDLTTAQFVFEIYSPYQTSEQEPFFEVGQMYRILNPGTDQRQYEVLSDIFIPDSYVMTRNYTIVTYFSEAMSPNDLYYKRWDDDSGKVNLIIKLGQTVKINSISFSNNFIARTQINGQSTFDAVDEKSLPIEAGALRKLQITSKVQDELGIVMLAICELETASLYIGEVQQYGSTGESSNIVTTESVIGTINVLKGSRGTKNPESVSEYKGRVFFGDANNGRWVQYSTNGLFDISDYKMVRFWKNWFYQYNSMSSEEIESFGNRPFLFSTVDPEHEELLISIPKLSSIPPKGYLPDYPDTIYPFDILDFQGKTMVFKIGDGEVMPHWQGAYTFNTEYFVILQNKLYSFKYGHLYRHNQVTNYNQFYGVQNKSRVMFISNKDTNVPKSYNSISIEGNMKPTLTYFFATVPYQQASDLVDYNNLEGILYATLYRNKLVPTATGYDTNGLLTGDKIRTHALSVMLEFSANGNIPLELRFVNIKYILSKGHKTV